tara:strand:- start:112 stop:810 length:699 start_codon:yes stop_codon:yes gene_type:complete
MGAAHTGNQGYIGKQIHRTVGDGVTYGVWQQSTFGLNIAQYSFVDPTPASTDIGWVHDEPDSGNEYVYSSRNLTVFYTDSYGTTTHINQYTNGSGSYPDARNVGNTQGGINNAGAFLVNNNNSKFGYKWVDTARIKGFKAHGKYGSRTFSNNGTLDILTWNGATWTMLEQDVDITNGGTVDWGTSTIQTYNFLGGVVNCKGLAVQANSVSTYWAINYFAPIDLNDNVFLGHT